MVPNISRMSQIVTEINFRLTVNHTKFFNTENEPDYDVLGSFDSTHQLLYYYSTYKKWLVYSIILTYDTGDTMGDSVNAC